MGTYKGKKMHHYSWQACFEGCLFHFSRGSRWEGLSSLFSTLEPVVDYWLHGNSLVDENMDGPSLTAWHDECKWGGCCAHARLWRSFWPVWQPCNITHYVESSRGDRFWSRVCWRWRISHHTHRIFDGGRETLSCSKGICHPATPVPSDLLNLLWTTVCVSRHYLPSHTAPIIPW